MVEGTHFRDTIGTFATGVTIVSIPGDPPHGMTASAVASVSLKPPLVLVCVDNGTKTYRLFNEEGVDKFCINILSKDQKGLAEHFAGMDELDYNPFNMDSVTTAEMSGSPVFKESLAYIDCFIYSRHLAGDHTIYIGEVEDATILRANGDPLIFYKGEFMTTN